MDGGDLYDYVETSGMAAGPESQVKLWYEDVLWVVEREKEGRRRRRRGCQVYQPWQARPGVWSPLLRILYAPERVNTQTHIGRTYVKAREERERDWTVFWCNCMHVWSKIFHDVLPLLTCLPRLCHRSGSCSWCPRSSICTTWPAMCTGMRATVAPL